MVPWAEGKDSSDVEQRKQEPQPKARKKTASLISTLFHLALRKWTYEDIILGKQLLG